MFAPKLILPADNKRPLGVGIIDAVCPTVVMISENIANNPRFLTFKLQFSSWLKSDKVF